MIKKKISSFPGDVVRAEPAPRPVLHPGRGDCQAPRCWGRVANTPSSPSTTTASADYLLCEGGGGTVTVGAAWTRVAQLLEVPPLDSTITLDIQVVIKFLCYAQWGRRIKIFIKGSDQLIKTCKTRRGSSVDIRPSTD